MDDATFLDRVLEQAEPWTPWDRRAWQPGTLLALKELVEAAEWCSKGVLSDESVQYLRSNQIRPDLGRDVGIGTNVIRSQLDDVLKKPFKYNTQSRRELSRLIEWIEPHYLRFWQDASHSEVFNGERAARFTVSHLLDLGFHPVYLRKTIRDIDPSASAAETVEELRLLASRPLTTFSGWVQLTSVPRIDLLKSSSSWIPPREVSRLLKESGKNASRSQWGGLRFEIEARDPVAAASVVHDRLTRLQNRARFLREPKVFEYVPHFRLFDGKAVSLMNHRAPISAMSLVKAGVLYRIERGSGSFDRIDDSFELASHLISSPPAVAVSNAWAAIEALLIDPAENDRNAGGRVVAADRAATIVANGWPRAELTRLSYLAEKTLAPSSRLRNILEEVGEDGNVKRCQAMLDHWHEIASLNSVPPRDLAAIDRITSLLDNPSATLGRVESYMKGSFRRLYRQRNLVMHGGEVRSVALVSTARTVGPLVGIFMDRISASAHLEGSEPLEAVAQATVALRSARKENNVSRTLFL